MNIPAHSSAALASPTETSTSGFTDFILGQLRCAALRSKIVTNQIEVASAALSAGLIAPEIAIIILAETGVELSS
jgi:hypothetical protein